MEPSAIEAATSYGLPTELIHGVVLEAERDAERVANFLNVFCEAFNALHPELGMGDKWKRMFPARFLLELAAALRMLEWESEGLITPAMQLPPAQETLHEVMVNMAREDGKPTLSLLVGQVFVDFFAWNARSQMGASIALDELDDEQLADEIANFLWNHRHDLEAN